jgi:hypothetical protein
LSNVSKKMTSYSPENLFYQHNHSLSWHSRSQLCHPHPYCSRLLWHRQVTRKSIWCLIIFFTKTRQCKIILIISWGEWSVVRISFPLERVNRSLSGEALEISLLSILRRHVTPLNSWTPLFKHVFAAAY